MQWLTEDAVLICAHVNGRVGIAPSQDLVSVEGRRVLVETDPEAKPVGGCPNVGPAIKPCALTLRVERGYSDLLRVEGRRICLDPVTGKTDGTPPGTVYYHVRATGQGLVEAQS